MMQIATNALSILPSIAHVIGVLHEHEISYCHFKGNEQHLSVSLGGFSDVDLLLSQQHQAKFGALIYDLGFRLFNKVRNVEGADVVEFLGVDKESGRLIHLHIHYRLPFGEPFVKGYRTGLEEHILATRVFNEKYCTYTISPTLEYVLIHFREAFALSPRRFLATSAFHRRSMAKSRIEFDYLKGKINKGQIVDLLSLVFRKANISAEAFAGDFSWKKLQVVRKALIQEFGNQAKYGVLHSTLLSFYREFRSKLRGKVIVWMNLPYPLRRTNATGGRIIVVHDDGRANTRAAIDKCRKLIGRKADFTFISFSDPISPSSINRMVKARSNGFIVLAHGTGTMAACDWADLTIVINQGPDASPVVGAKTIGILSSGDEDAAVHDAGHIMSAVWSIL